MAYPELNPEAAPESSESAVESVPTENVQDFLSSNADTPFAKKKDPAPRPDELAAATSSESSDASPESKDTPSETEKEKTDTIKPDSPEGNIYEEAGVDLQNPKTEILQGQEYTVYELPIDPDLVGPDGRTNRERMENGEAPYVDKNGKLERVELHHNEQQNDTLVELDQSTHRTNNEVLHPKRGEGEGRGHDPDWDAKRKEHWQNRAKEFEV